jgi:tryptophanyl-tRNA synthetase
MEYMSRKKRILSGMRPTGPLHMGNLLGALTNWVKLQDEYECFYFIADWHALTSDYEDTARIKDYTKEIIIDWLSAGLTPEKSTLFVQSQIKEHAELFLILGMITPVPWLERNPTYKEQIAQNLIAALEPIREKRTFYETHLERVDEIISEGCDKARMTARVTMESVRTAIKIN